jgi:two-component system, LuxR family, response regulator FixJ
MVEREVLVYVVDDDESVRRGFQLLLLSAGFNVRTFSSAKEFLESISPSDSGLIVLDMRMPGITGLDLLKILAHRKKRMKIIAISAFGDAPTTALARELGAVAFFQKPVDGQALIDAIHWARGDAKSSFAPSDS